MATSIQRYSGSKEEISNSDCSASNYIKQPHQNRRMHLHMKIKQRNKKDLDLRGVSSHKVLFTQKAD